MYNMKGFLVVGALSDNAPGEVPAFGEISADAMTYAIDRGIYTDGDYAGVGIIAFTSFDTEDGDTQIEMPIAQRTQALKITKWVNDQADAGMVGDERDALFTLIMNQFGSQITNLTFGEIKQDGLRYMPEWIAWDQILAAGGESIARFKIWYSDPAFRTQYDEFTILVVTPIDNLDDFFKDPLVVKRIVEERTMTQTMDKIQEIRKLNPFTINRSDPFDYNDPEDPEYKVPTNWITLHYGIAGNNIDSVKEAIVKHILANSTHTREEWVKIFPELFTSTEFCCVPMWLDYATPNKTNQAGVPSPIMQFKRALELATLACKTPGYNEVHLNEYGSSLPVMWKSMNIFVIGGPENRNGTYLLTDYMKDYINTPTGSIDFNRMSEKTREWVLLLERLLEAANTMTEFSDVPPGINRLSRYGVLMAAASYDKVQYLVVARQWLEKAADEEPTIPPLT